MFRQTSGDGKEGGARGLRSLTNPHRARTVARPFPMKNSVVSLFTAVLASSLIAHAAGPPRFYPTADAPLAAEPMLAKVESAFVVATPQPTLKFPLPPTGARLATRDEFLIALEAAITADPANAAGIVLAARKAARISDGSPLNRPVAADVADLLFAAGTVPATISHFGEILDALLAEDPANAVFISANAMSAAAIGGATAADLGAMARAGIAALVNGFKPADAPFEEFARAVLVGTITPDLTGADNPALASAIIKGMIRGIRDIGMETPLLDDVVRGAARAYGSMPNVTLTHIITAAFAEATATRHHAILIAAACVLGTPFFFLDSPIDQEVAAAGAAAAPTFSTAISVAATHGLLIRVTELRVVASETLTRLQTDGTADSDAIVCAALMASPTKLYDILRAGFDGSYGPGITPPPISFTQWLRVVLSGNPKSVAEGVDLVLDKGNSEGLFVNGITPAGALGAMLTAVAPASTSPVIDKVKMRIASGGGTDIPEDAGAITGAITASPQPIDVAAIVAPLLLGTVAEKSVTLKKEILGTTDAVIRGVIAAAAILAEPANTAAYTAAALAADPSAADNSAISSVIAGLQVGIVATQPKWRVSDVAKSLVASHAGAGRAVVFGALVAAPEQALAILSGAMAADATFDLQMARALDPADAPSLALAAEIATAEFADAADPGATLAMLFDTVESAVLAHPTDVLNLTAAAAIAAPRYAHHTLHAAAFCYPDLAMRTVVSVFDAGPVASPGNQTARAAAIGAALINGLREARTGKRAITQMRLAVGAAVKAARVLSGPSVATSNGAVNRATLTTNNGPAAIITGVVSQLVMPTDTALHGAFVLTAAVPKAPGHALAITQAAAQAAVSIAGAKVNTNSIVAAVAAGAPPFTALQIRNAAMFGKLKARQSVPGAGADGVLNYLHHSGTTDPIPSLEGF